MAAQNPPYALQTGSHGSELFRRAVGSVLNSTGGVVGLSDLLVTQNGTANMSVNVAGGRPGGEAWVAGSTTTELSTFRLLRRTPRTLESTLFMLRYKTPPTQARPTLGSWLLPLARRPPVPPCQT